MSSFLASLSALNRAKVRYVVVGGFASVMHGNNRFTADIDVVVDLTPESAKRTVESLVAAGLKPTLQIESGSFADPAVRAELKTKKNLRFFSLYDPENPTFGIDLFLEPPLDFERLYKNSVELPLRGENCRICSLEDLIAMKEQANRPQDILDLQVLRILNEKRPGK